MADGNTSPSSTSTAGASSIPPTGTSIIGAAAAAKRIVPKAGLYAAYPTSAVAAGATVFYLKVDKKQRIWFMHS